MTLVPESQQEKDSASRFFILEKRSQDDFLLSRIRKHELGEGHVDKDVDHDESPYSPYGSPKYLNSPQRSRKSVDYSRRSSNAASEIIDYQALMEGAPPPPPLILLYIIISLRFYPPAFSAMHFDPSPSLPVSSFLLILERERNMLLALGSEKSTTSVLEAKVQARLESKRSEKELRRLSQITFGTAPGSASMKKADSNRFRGDHDNSRHDNVLPAVPRSKLQRQSSLQQIANRKFSDPLIASSLVHALFGHGPSHATLLGLGLGSKDSSSHGFATSSRHPLISKNNSSNNMDGFFESAKTFTSSSLPGEASRGDLTHERGIHLPIASNRVPLSPLFQSTEPPPFVIQLPQEKLCLNPKLEAQWREEKEYLERLAKKGVFVAAGTTDSLLPLPSLELGEVAADVRKKFFEKKGYGFSEKTEISMAGREISTVLDDFPSLPFFHIIHHNPIFWQVLRILMARGFIRER